MEMENILNFLDNKTILVTGATGYLAKIFVEKILRVQPNVKKFYLLLRAIDANSAMKRLQEEVIGKDLFKVLREKYGESLNSFVAKKVIPIAGDISFEDLGIKDSYLKDEMWREIDLVLNFAATTNFDERYEIALSINTFGALNVLNFAKKCLNVKMLVHVSTAYVCGEDAGIILEKPFSMGEAKKGTKKIDIEAEKKLALEKLNELLLANASKKEMEAFTKDFGCERAREYGWPNTYVFTKAMGEMLLMNFKETIPLIIIRPTMITSTYKEPFPGWIEGLRTIDSVIACVGNGKVASMVCNPLTILDVIPSDMVVNAIIIAMVAHGKQCSEIIYHIGSSLRNPMEILDTCDFTFRYFTTNPWVGKDGIPVKVNNVTILSSMAAFYIYMAIRFQLPLKALQLIDILVFQKFHNQYSTFDRKLKLMMRFVKLYKAYMFFEGIFDDTNSEELRRAVSDEINEFNFDPTTIDWEDYMMNVHIPGLIKYVMK